MHISLANSEVRKLLAALAKAGRREIGGQMFGEQLAPSRFRVTELTVQNSQGTVVRFVVDLVQAARDAIHFFQRTRRDYLRFNYIGEWHSHPSFDIAPSSTDTDAMRVLVRDAAFRGNFAVLMIVRSDLDGLKCGAWMFASNGVEADVQLEVEHEQ